MLNLQNIISTHSIRRSGVPTTNQLCSYTLATNQSINFGSVLNTELTGLPVVTITTFIKRSAIGTGQLIVSKYGNNNVGFMLDFQTDNTIRYYHSNNNTGVDAETIATTTTFTDTTKTMKIDLVLDYNQALFLNAVKIYVDGILQPRTTTDANTQAMYASTANLMFGAREAGGRFFNGLFFNSAVYNVAKTASEILDDWNYFVQNGVPPIPTTNLLLYTPYKNDPWDGSNHVVIDDSGNGYNGATVNILEGGHTCEQLAGKDNMVSENKRFNSIVYSDEGTYKKLSTSSEVRFNYSGTYLGLQAYVSNAVITTVLVDNVFYTSINLVHNTGRVLTLPVGSKEVTIIQGAVNSSSITGAYLTHIMVDNDTSSILTEGNVATRYVFLGDSITGGASASNSAVNGYAQQHKYKRGLPVTIIGYAGATVQGIANTNLATTLSWVTAAFANTTTTKVLYIMLGTNDFTNSTSATSINTWYSALVDAINSNDSSIEIRVITPTIRTDDGVLLDTYRANMVTMCASRGWCTSIDGKAAVDIGNLAGDGLHLSTEGHLQLYNAL